MIRDYVDAESREVSQSLAKSRRVSQSPTKSRGVLCRVMPDAGARQVFCPIANFGIFLNIVVVYCL